MCGYRESLTDTILNRHFVSKHTPKSASGKYRSRTLHWPFVSASNHELV